MSKENSYPNAVQKEEEASKVDLETLLVHELGQFGRYQRRLVPLVMVVAAAAALSTFEYIFTTARIETRCLIPECEDPSGPIEFSPSWILNAVPGAGASFDNCRRFANTSAPPDHEEGTCPATLFNQNDIVNCEEHVYENTETVVYSFDLACDEWRRTLIGSVRTLGSLAALPLTGAVSDRWGRRTALVINALNTTWMGIARYWAHTYAGFVSSQFFEAFVGSGTFSCIYILVMELVGPKYRVTIGATVNTFFSTGQMIVGLVAWGVPHWRHLTLALYVPQLLVIGYYWIIPESISWYQSKGKHDKAEAAVRNIARVNGKRLSDKTLVALRETAEEANRKKNEKNDKEPWLIVQVFRNEQILVRCLVSPVWWVTATLVYYGMSINAVNMVGHKYLNYVAVAAVEIPGFWIGVALSDRIGRKAVLVGAFWICAVCQVAYIFISDDLVGLSLAVYLVGKCSIAVVALVIYVYTAELYPTKYRHSLFAFSSMVGRIGSIVAPLTPALNDSVWEHLTSVLFACMAFLAGSLILVTPETLGSKMPDTMEQAASIGKASHAVEQATSGECRADVVRDKREDYNVSTV